MRNAAMNDRFEELKELILTRANPCSTDEFGLSALHYAVWNGHIECIKLLVCNPAGVDKERNRCSVLGLKSTMGYTALHLAAMECPRRVAKECTMLLLLGGIDPMVRSSEEDQTAMQMARALNNGECLAAINEFKAARSNDEIKQKLISLRDGLIKKYRFQSNTMVAGKLGDIDAGFKFPEFLFEEERVGNVPNELAIHEHHIRPLVETGFYDMNGMEAMRCLEFSNEQAQVNKMRRDRLMASADPTFKPERSNLL